MDLFLILWQPILFLLLSLAILIWGADKFVDYSSILAKKLGINELTIGLTVVALGTSAPEIFVGISSIVNQTESIAMGTVVGSNISNIALIFGVASLGRTLKPKQTPSKQLIPVILSTGILGFAIYDLYISFFESLILLLVLIQFMFITFQNRSESIADQSIHTQNKNNISIILFLSIGLAALIFGSKYAVINAKEIAKILEISELIIGLTVVAIGTSLPELAATISAIIKNKTDMVIGNVIGSNVLNIVLVVPMIGFISKAKLDPELFNRDYIVMVVLTCIFLFMVKLQSTKFVNILSIRVLGFLMILSYLFYIALLSRLI
jgi:cation:H+ antiporter